jgi:triacylglycerol esterase/lipase EstA (alpha/beta hydrolase family)
MSRQTVRAPNPPSVTTLSASVAALLKYLRRLCTELPGNFTSQTASAQPPKPRDPDGSGRTATTASFTQRSLRDGASKYILSALLVLAAFQSTEALAQLSLPCSVGGGGYGFLQCIDEDRVTDTLNHKTPLLLIRGYDPRAIHVQPPTRLESQADWSNFLSYFYGHQELTDKYKIYYFSYSNNDISISALGGILRDVLDSQNTIDPAFGNRPLVVLAHSMGGLIARSFMQQRQSTSRWSGKPGGERVEKLITLATPHHGTPLANNTTGSIRAKHIPDQGAAQIFSFFIGGAAYNQVDRSDLRWDNYDNLLDYGQFPDEANSWLLTTLNGDTTYDNRIVAYAGEISADHANILIDYYSGGAVLIDEILGYPLTQLSSDGVVPTRSARFDGHTVLWSLARLFEDHNHSEMKDDINCVGGGCLFGRLGLDLAPVRWTTKPPQSLKSGDPFTVSWTIAGGASFGHTNIHYDTIDDVSAQTCLSRSSCQASPQQSGANGAFSATITAPAVSTTTTYYFAVHGNVDGFDVLSPVVAVTVSPSLVSTPAKPAGAASGSMGNSYAYTTSGSSSSDGGAIQYRFSWGDGTYSTWLSAGVLSASHTWTSAGSYYVQAQARSTATPPVYSAMSPSLSVTITGTVTVPTSLNITATLPAAGVAPYSAITVSGTVAYNTGVSISTGTVTIATGEGTFTAVITNGAYSRTITAPSTSRNTQFSARDDRYGLTGSVAPFLTVLSNQSGEGYQLDRTTTSRDVQSTSPYDPIFETEFFRRTDTKALVWAGFTNLYRAIRTRFDYYGPSGNLETSYTSPWTDDPAAHGGLYYDWWKLWSWLWIYNSGGAYRPGRWSCQVFVDNGTGWKYLRTESFTIGYEFAEHRMAQGVQSSSPFDPITPTNTFQNTDAQAYTWARLANVVEGLGVKWDFYEPNGSLYFSFTYDAADPGTDRYYPDFRTWGYINIAGTAAVSKCGDWRVAVSIKDIAGNYQAIYTDYFQVLEAAGLPPTAVTATVPAIPAAGEVFTLGVQASDNTYLKKVVLYWNDGTLHTRTWDNIFAPLLTQFVSVGPYPEGRQIEIWAEAWDTSGNRRETAHSIMVVSPALAVAGPASLPAGLLGSIYPSTTMAAMGGSAPYTWKATGLPTGLMINSSTGEISGTPGTTGCPAAVNITATDTEARTTSKAYSLTINPATPTISAFGTFCDDGSVTLVSSSSSGNQWFKDGPAIPGATGQTYATTAAGLYMVQVTTNGCLSAVSAPTILGSDTCTLTAPSSVVATATSPTSVSISWNTVPGATSYKIYRTSSSGSSLIASPSGISYTDSLASSGTSYIYQVQSVNFTSSSTLSSGDLATTVIFTDGTLIGGSSSIGIRRVHFEELRTAVNAVRVLAGLGTFSFTDSSLNGLTVKATHLNELRIALLEARNALGLATPAYADSTVATGTTIKAVHISQLRANVQ